LDTRLRAANVCARVALSGRNPSSERHRGGAGLIVAATTHPRCLEPLRERFRAWQQAIERDGIDPVRATVVRLAADGFWLAALLGLWSPSRTLQQHVLHELIQLTRETPQSCMGYTQDPYKKYR